jgi:hypothetical protein
MVVMAFAGTGKTSTLEEFARQRPVSRMLYIVLNKANQVEAERKFRGSMVKPVTSHALAYRVIGYQYKHKLVGGIRPYQVDKALNISKSLSGICYGDNYNNNMVIASVIADTLNRFLYSTDAEIKKKHLPDGLDRAVSILGLEAKVAAPIIIALANRLWEKMIDIGDSSVGMLHDGYLKLFQLSKPKLPEYDYFLIDESQDTNPVTMSIIFNQDGKKVLVGDGHQAIYGWRGAKNALGFAIKQGAIVHYLTSSFRFGDNIARVANQILAIKGESVLLRGLGGEDRIGQIPEDQNKTIISRTNAGVFGRTAWALHNNKTWWHVGGSEGYKFDQIMEVYYLWKRLPGLIKDPFL